MTPGKSRQFQLRRGDQRCGTTALRSKHTSNGHHAKTDTAECSDRFPLTGIEISDSTQAGLTVPLLTARRDTKLHRLLPPSCPSVQPALGFWGVSDTVSGF